MSQNQPEFHYKSHLTQQKLLDYKSRSIDHFDLDNINDFDKKFQQFSETFQQKYFPETTISSQNDQNKLQRKKTMIQRFASQDTLINNNQFTHQQSSNEAGILKKSSNSLKKNPKMTSVNFEESQLAQTAFQNNSNHNAKNIQPLSGLVDQRFKLMLQKNSQKETQNPVVQYFGNQLIATVFQSLLIKTLEEKFHIKINMECDIPISQNVLKMFDLSTVVINNLKGIDKKKEYIYQTMCAKIDSLLQNFDEKVNQKEQLIERQEEMNKKKMKSIQSDHFTWLKLKASHDNLKKKLRQMIVEKLSEYENLILIENTIEKKQQLRDAGKIDQSNKISCDLQNFQYTSTKEVFKKMSTYGNHKIKLYLSRLGITKYSDDNPAAIINKSKQKRSNSEDQIIISPNGKNKHQRKQSDSLNKTGIKGYQNNEIDAEKFWTQEREKEFQQQRSEKKFIYSSEVVATNWNDVGFLPFVQRYILEYKKSIHRERGQLFIKNLDTLLNRYTSGEWLTVEELKFLANTSELLNSCVDKKYMQKAVNVINSDLLENMELGLAEQILSNYEDAKLAIKRARQNYIKEKQEDQQEWLREQYQKAENARQKIQNAKFYRRYYRIFTVLLDKMENEQKFADKLPENIHGAEYLNEYLLGKASEKESIQKIYKIGKLSEFEFKNYIEKKKQQQKEKQDQENQSKRFKKLSKPISYTNDDFIKNMKRRKYHPSSKLFIEKHNSSSDEDVRRDLTIEQQENIRYSRQKKEKIQQEEIEKYQLNLKSIDLLKEKPNFKKFYSGGPQKQSNQQTIYERFRTTGINSCTPHEMRSILIIQKRFRAFLKRKQLVQFLRNNQIKKDYQYKNIIDQIQMNPNQIHLKIKDSFNPAKPSIDDIQILITKKKQSQQIRASLLRVMSRSNSMCSVKGVDKSFTFMSQKHSRNPSLNSAVPHTPIHQDDNKSPLLEKISVINEKSNPQYGMTTPINKAKSPTNELNRSKSGSRSGKFIQLNQGSNHYFTSFVKMQQDMAETHKRVLAQSASPNHFLKGERSEIQDSRTGYTGYDAKSTQFSTIKKGDYASINQLSHLSEQNKDGKNITIDLYNRKQSNKSEDNDESCDKFDADIQHHETQASPGKKINQQTFSNNLYQQKRASLLFKIPSSAVKINKYIDTNNVMQQFALKELLLPKTPKENMLFNNKNLHQKPVGTKITDAFNKNVKGSNNNMDKTYSYNSSQTPSTQISQFQFQTPSSGNMNQKVSDKHFSAAVGHSINNKAMMDNILPASPHSSQNDMEDTISEDAVVNLPITIPDMTKLDPPQIFEQPTIKQQRLLAASENNKLQLITNSGFIFYEDDINARDKQGNTALHIAAKHNYTQFITWLLSKKANPNLRNKNGWTPLHFALQSNKIEGIILITSAGGDLNILNKKGETPLALGSQKLLSTLGLEKGIAIVRQDEESLKCGYLKSFNNNSLLEKRSKTNEFEAENALFKTNKLHNNLQQVVVNNKIISFE